MPLQSLATSGLVDQVVDAMLTLIREEGLGPGDILPSQASLIAELDIGRTTMREAIQHLVALGAIEVRPGKRMVVGSAIGHGQWRSAAELERCLRHAALSEIAEVRDLLEPEVAALAARRGTEPEICQLEGIVERMRGSIESASVVELNVAFHCAVGQATHNEALAHILEVVMDMLSPLQDELAQRLRERVPQYESDVEHLPILEALRQGDSVKARRAMRDHIRIFNEFVTDLYGPLRNGERPSCRGRPKKGEAEA